MDTKICFKCGRELSIDNFYKHPDMKDGHLNKCIECSKNDIHKRYLLVSQTEEYMEKERKRGRDKYKRLNYKERNVENTTINNNTIKMLHKKATRKGYNLLNKELHHWNYNELNSVFVLSRKAHKCIHKNIIVNYTDKYCYTLSNIKISSLEYAINLFRKILEDNGFDEKFYVINL